MPADIDTRNLRSPTRAGTVAESRSVRPPFVPLLLEDWKAVFRGPFALVGTTLGFALVTVLSVFAGLGGPDGVPSWLLITHVLFTPFLAPVAAALIAHPRVSSFADALFTAPVTRRGHFASRALVATGLGVAYLIGIQPFVLLVAWQVGLPATYLNYVGAGLALVVASVGLGLLIGVLFASRPLSGSLVTSAILAISGDVAIALVGNLAQGGRTPMQDILLRAAHASPQVLALESFGIPFGASSTTAPLVAGALLAMLTIGSTTLAAWVYLTRQDVHRWHEGWGARVGVLALVALLLVLPAVTASTEFTTEPRKRPEGFPTRSDILVSIVTPGTSPDAHTFIPYLGSSKHPLVRGEPTRMDLLVLLALSPGDDLRAVDVQAEADPAVRVHGLKGGSLASLASGSAVWPEFPPGPRSGTDSLYVRFPVTITIESVDALTRTPSVVNLSVKYSVGAQRHDSTAPLVVFAGVAAAEAKTVAVGAVLPTVLACAALRRRMKLGGSS